MRANLITECALGEITAMITGQQPAPRVTQAATRTGNRNRRRAIRIVHEAQRNGLAHRVPDAPYLPLTLKSVAMTHRSLSDAVLITSSGDWSLGHVVCDEARMESRHLRQVGF